MHVINASEANRSFSRLLRQATEGRRVTVFSRGRLVATIGPAQARRPERAAAPACIHAVGALVAQRAVLTSGSRPMRAAVDTHMLGEAEVFGDTARCAAALHLLEQLRAYSVLLPLRVLGELARVLVVKAGQPADPARRAVLSWADSFAVADSSGRPAGGFYLGRGDADQPPRATC